MDCPNCGKQNSGDSPLCSSCGWVLCWKPVTHKVYRRRARPWLIPVLISAFMLLTILALSGLFSTTSERGSEVEYIDISEESMAPYQSIYEVDRRAIGFPPLPSKGTVKVESIDRETWNCEWDPPNYDVLLHFYDTRKNNYKHTERYIALKNENGVLQWVSESMMFQGPKEYINDEGFSTKEWISLRCETEQGATGGKYTTGTMAMYSGPDERLIGEEGWTIDGGDLSLADVVPILREWGYVYEVAGFERP